MSELALIKNVSAVEVYENKGLDQILEQIEKEASGIVPDLSTVKGRKAIASLAANVARSKTYLDELGKNLVAGIKEQAKVIDTDRKRMRDRLDDLKAKVRQPLTEWEQAEADRIADLEARLLALSNHCLVGWMDNSTDILMELLGDVNNIVIDDSWGEYEAPAHAAKDKAKSHLAAAIESRMKYDAEQAELVRLREQQAEREKAEHEEKLRREGEERARREAEEKEQARLQAEKAAQAAADEKARLAAEAADKARLDAIMEKEKAELRAMEAEKNAKREADEAVERERLRAEDERIKEQAAARLREADNKHRAKINNAAMNAMVTGGIPAAHAKKAVTLIAQGKVPHARIDY